MGSLEFFTESTLRAILWPEGSTQPLIKLNTSRCLGLTTLPPSCADCAGIPRASTSWSPKGLPRPVMGLLYLLITDIYWTEFLQEAPNLYISSYFTSCVFNDSTHELEMKFPFLLRRFRCCSIERLTAKHNGEIILTIEWQWCPSQLAARSTA